MLDKPSVIYFFLDNYYHITPGDFSQSRIYPTYHFVQFRGLSGKVIARSFFMDDFGTLQPICFTKLAVTLTGGY